jgi:phage FluMu protein Com/uncharacterized membrane protein
MSIEFRCVHCSKLLRTGDDTAGKQAKCPECGTLMTVPAAAEAGELSASAAGNDNPFGTAGLAASYQAESGNPYQSPSPFSHIEPSASAGSPGAIVPSMLDLNDVLTRTWEIFKKQFWMSVLVCFIVFVLDQVFSNGLGFVAGILGALSRDQGIQAVFTLIAQLASICFTIWLNIGQAKYFLKIARGQTAEVTEIFSGGPRFLPILGVCLLVGLIVGLGLLALIVPGIILGCMFSQAYYLVLDRRMGVIESMSLSSELTKGNKGTIFLIGLLAFGIMIAGLLALCVGYFVAMPFIALMSAVTYLAITGQPTADRLQERPMG